MLQLLTLQNLKTILIIAGIAVIIWLWKDYQYQIAENDRQTANIVSIRKMDSLKFAAQTYTKKELDQYLEYSRKDLQKFLHENRINTKRIEKIITQKLKFQDNTNQSQSIQP